MDPPNVWNKIKSLRWLKRNNQINILNNETDNTFPKQEAAKQLGEYFGERKQYVLNYSYKFRNKKLNAKILPIQLKVNSNNTQQIHRNEEIPINEFLSKYKSKNFGPSRLQYSFFHHLALDDELICAIFLMRIQQWRKKRAQLTKEPLWKNRFQLPTRKRHIIF